MHVNNFIFAAATGIYHGAKYGVNITTVNATLSTVLALWSHWTDTWGWDDALLATSMSRLGWSPEEIVTRALLDPQFEYYKNGHTRCCPTYLPGSVSRHQSQYGVIILYCDSYCVSIPLSSCKHVCTCVILGTRETLLLTASPRINYHYIFTRRVQKRGTTPGGCDAIFRNGHIAAIELPGLVGRCGRRV